MSGEGERIAKLEEFKEGTLIKCREEAEIREKIFTAISELRSRMDKAAGAVIVLCGIASVGGAVLGQVLAKHFGG
jgi:ribosomal protein S3